MANPLPVACSFFPDTQAWSRLCRQLLEVDRLLHRNHVGNHNVVAAHGRLKIVKLYPANVQVFDQRYFAGPVARSILMNGLKTFSDLLSTTSQFFALMSSHICFSIFSPSLLVEFILDRY